MNDREVRKQCEAFRRNLNLSCYCAVRPLDPDFVQRFNEFVAAYPDVLEWKAKNGTLLKALFYYLVQAIVQKYLFTAWKALVIRTPQVLAETDEWGWTLLHHLCCHNPKALDVIPFFVEQFPDATKMKSFWQSTPLHVACMKHAPLPVIRILVEANWHAVYSCDQDGGDAPLHNACGEDASLDVIQYFVKQAPQMCLHRNDGRDLPLHKAKKARGREHDDVIEFMVTATTAAADGLMEQLCFAGQLPREIFENVATHLATNDDVPVQVVSAVELALSGNEIEILFRRDYICKELFGQL